jgi:hypothetical protein
MLYSAGYLYLYTVYFWYAFGVVSTFFVHHMATTWEGWYHILMVIETDMSGMKHFLKVRKMYTYIVVCLDGLQRGKQLIVQIFEGT